MVQIRPIPALFVDAKALNNEASVHAYNRELKVRLPIAFGSRREKEVHKNIFGGDRDSICTACGAKTAVQLRTPPPIYLTQNFTNTLLTYFKEKA